MAKDFEEKNVLFLACNILFVELCKIRIYKILSYIFLENNIKITENDVKIPKLVYGYE